LARKILLADDSVTAQNMGRKILADAGYEVITVNNGSAALKKIAEQKPDLIILDVYMPGYSGLEVCQRLKDAQESSRVPVLLTVGKLEPFKPEEAKRVRADGFIVKPFEASELLSALSKLEDKIVPRAEASKPGRLARVTASLDEGRYDRTVAMDGDSGWKDRISFPSKKKEKSAAEEGESAAISNAAARERKPAEKPRAIRAEEARVDLGALAPEGLPKDVTPEEIAALAAAAAQVKGKIAEFTEAPADQAQSEKGEPTQLGAALPQDVSAAAVPVAPVVEQKFEEKFEEKIEEKIDAPEEKFREAPAEAASMTAASYSDLMAAIAGLDPGATALPSISSGNGFSSQHAADPTANEPVTMAISAGAGPMGETPRWTAVSVAVDKEEAAISLEQEMQKAYAAFAAAVIGHAPSIPAVPEARLDAVELAAAKESSSAPQAALSEPVVSLPALPAPEAAQTLSAMGNASTEAIRAAVNELEMVAESYSGETAVPAPDGPGPAPVVETEAAAPLAAEAPQTVDAIAKESPTVAAWEPQSEAAKLDTAKHTEANSWVHEPKSQEWNNQDRTNEDQKSADQKSEEQKSEDRKSEDRKNEDWKSEDWKNKEPYAAAASESYGTAAEKHEVAASAFVNEGPAEQTSASQGSSSGETAAAQEPVAHGNGEMAKKESDGAETTAAAWASWRRIRESGDSTAIPDEATQKEEAFTPPDAAAMAVAAGAEKTPAAEESESDPAAIANIVDSVLADLRPKIFEEISRKMGKKK
jgi:CheY-like chemotaxis protein